MNDSKYNSVATWLATGRKWVVGLVVLMVLSGCSDKPTETVETHSAVPSPAPPAATTTIIEAETMTIDGSFVKTELADASDKTAMRIPGEADCSKVTEGKTPKPIGSLTTEFSMTTDKTVNIWVRVKWTGTCSNSFSIELPNGMKKTVTSSTYNNWLWLPAAKNMPLKAGTHRIGVTAREFGTLIDQIFITDDLERIPRGIERDYATDVSE